MGTSNSESHSASGNSPEAIGARVVQLVREHSLSALAAKTGTPVSSLHRYANGGRVPAEFCGALAKELSVNPMWFLLGEGPTYLTEMGGTAEVLATGMRDLVAALKAASKMKLGTLAHRKDLGLLRELSMAVREHESIREKLGARIEPVAQEWLAALRSTLERRDREHAQDISEALERLLALTDDPALRHELDRHRALLAYVDGRRGEAVELQRRNLLTQLIGAGDVTDATVREGYNLMAALSGLGRMIEAGRLGRALMALRSPDAPEVPVVRMLEGMLGLCELSCGNVSAAREVIPDVYRRRTDNDAPTQEFLMASLLMRTGVISVRSALQDYLPSVQLAVEALRQALLIEDVELLTDTLESLREKGLGQISGTQLFAVQARWLIAELRGNVRRPADEELKVHEDILLQTPVMGEIEVAVLACQRARISGHRNAATLALQADKLFPKPGAEIGPDQVARGLHAKNVLLLAPRRPKLKKVAARARESIRTMLDQGFGMFREFALEQNI